jgi:WG containing repeat
MKLFILISVLCCSVTSIAQTVSSEFYRSKTLKTRYHIRQKDTFLIERFRLNGTLETQTWHNDSIYYFDNQGFIDEKHFVHKERPELDEVFTPIFDLAKKGRGQKRHGSYPPMLVDSLCQYEKGQLQSYAYCLGDSGFVHHRLTSKTTDLLRLLSPERVYVRRGGTLDYAEIVLDTALHQCEVQIFKAGKRVEQTICKDISPIDYLEDLLARRFDAFGEIHLPKPFDANRVKLFKDNGLCLYGFEDMKGKVVIAPQYENITKVDHGEETYYIVQKEKYQLLNEYGKLVSTQEWDYLAVSEGQDKQQILRYKQGKTSGIMDFQGKINFKFDCQEVYYYNSNLYEIKINEKYGLADHTGRVLIPPHYAYFPKKDWKTQNVLYAVDSTTPFTNKTALIDTQDRMLIPFFWGDLKEITTDIFEIEPKKAPKRLFKSSKGWIWDDIATYKSDENGYFRLLSPKTHKWGLAYKDTLLLPFEYDTLVERHRVLRSESDGQEQWENLPYIATKQGKYGLFDPNLKKWVMPLQYDGLQEFINDTLFAILVQNKWSIVNQQQQKVLKTQFDQIGWSIESDKYDTYCLDFGILKDTILFYNKESFPMTTALEDVSWHWAYSRSDSKRPVIIQGFVFGRKPMYFNDLGKVIIDAGYTKVTWHGSKNRIAIATKSNGQQVLIDETGKQQPLSNRYRIISVAPEPELLIVQDTVSKLYGSISMQNKIILPCQYTVIQSLDDHQVIWARKRPLPNPVSGQPLHSDPYEQQLNGGWLAYDKNGKLLISKELEYAFRWEDSLGVGRIGNKQGVWDANGREIIPPHYDWIWYDDRSQMFHLFQKVAEKKYQVGFANAAGQIIIDAILTDMSYFDNDFAVVRVGNDLGIVDKKGKYWLKPTQNILMDSVNWAKKLLMFQPEDEEEGNRRIDYLFSQIGNSKIQAFKQIIFQLSAEQQTDIWNLLLSKRMDNYFLDANEMKRNISRNDLFFNQLTHQRFEVVGALAHDKCTTFDLQVEQDRVHLGRHLWTDYHKPFYVTQQFETYLFKDGQWQQLQLDDFLNLNADNIAGLNRLIQQKVSQLRDIELQCSDVNAYIQIIKNQCFIHKDGIECFMKGRQIGDTNYVQYKTVSIWLDAELLKPFLRK